MDETNNPNNPMPAGDTPVTPAPAADPMMDPAATPAPEAPAEGGDATPAA